MEEKSCIKCGQVKSLENFYINSYYKDRRINTCKKCFVLVSQKNQHKLNGVYGIYRRNAKTRGLEFNLSKEDFSTFWQKPCSFCGSLIPSAGLDRIDSSKGYFLGNVIPCCTFCNMAKRKLSISDFLLHIFKIANFSLRDRFVTA